MRHDLCTCPITPGARGVCEAAATARLVAASSRSDRSAARLGRARSAAVDLAAITAATDQDLHAATAAQKQTPVVGHRRLDRAQERWTPRQDECNNARRTRVQHSVGRDDGSLRTWGCRRARSLGRADYLRRSTTEADRQRAAAPLRSRPYRIRRTQSGCAALRWPLKAAPCGRRQKTRERQRTTKLRPLHREHHQRKRSEKLVVI